ncbi:hypothetical protein BsWGS_16679 [Bradybaena similaris]
MKNFTTIYRHTDITVLLLDKHQQ